MAQIDWNKQVIVIENGHDGDHYVVTSGGYMLASEYVDDGGCVESLDQDTSIREVGRFTHLELQALYG